MRSRPPAGGASWRTADDVVAALRSVHLVLDPAEVQRLGANRASRRAMRSAPTVSAAVEFLHARAREANPSAPGFAMTAPPLLGLSHAIGAVGNRAMWAHLAAHPGPSVFAPFAAPASAAPGLTRSPS
ncbi:hypothetical protein [Agromyces kandeliae]|uniref:Uncharacterized protein n=1 Tax=Agromyces kandeliae TaxID=2666141 RepID=A0A6L5QXC7_9MICO|nr:hypothetical protein [Agromyces kandeliae]MRX42345.1 hypothetical protein [Agromyces kandeliae]